MFKWILSVSLNIRYKYLYIYTYFCYQGLTSISYVIIHLLYSDTLSPPWTVSFIHHDLFYPPWPISSTMTYFIHPSWPIFSAMTFLIHHDLFHPSWSNLPTLFIHHDPLLSPLTTLPWHPLELYHYVEVAGTEGQG